MEETTPDAIVTAAFADFAGYIPAVATAAIGITVLLWGTKKLIGFFKGVAK